MSEKLWKSVERKIAELLNGKRIPITGRARGSTPDVAHDFFSIEVKHRQGLPDWIHDAMNQADAGNDGEKIPLVILHQKGQAYPDSYAVLRLGDLIEIQTELEDALDKIESLTARPSEI